MRFASQAASSSQALAPTASPPTQACRSFYGVGAGEPAGDSAADGEGLAGLCTEPAVVLRCVWVRVGVGDGLAAAVVVAVDPCC